MVDVSVFEHTVEKPVLQNSINYVDTTINCNLLVLIDVSRVLEAILDGNEDNPYVTNRGTPKINFNIGSTRDKSVNNDSEFLDGKPQ